MEMASDITSMVDVYNGRERVGYYFVDGRCHHTWDASERYLGGFPTRAEAVAAISAAKRSKPATGGPLRHG